MQEYYSRRAQEYERIYHRNDSVRQREQAAIALAMKEILFNRQVLEVACGTGFWTKVTASVSQHIVAVDSSLEMLALAQDKELAPGMVEFLKGDAYTLELVPGKFNAGLANFWFSHVPKMSMDKFLHGFHKRLGTGAVVFMADNVYISGMGGEQLARQGSEDTFKLRELSDGSKYEVIKNYYDADQLHRILAPQVSNLKVNFGRCFWWVSYEVSNS